MKAFRITAPGTFDFVEIPVPVIGPDEVLVRTVFVGFCGSDLSTYRGRNPLVSLPRIPGHEISGIIEALGSAVPPDLKPGMPVTVHPYTACGSCPACLRQRPNACENNQTMGVQREGAMTGYIAVPWRKIVSVPGLPPLSLALVEPIAVGCHAVRRGEVRPGELVLVLGCGAIGLGAIAAVAARGATAVAVDLDPEKLETARRAGAAHTINSAAEDVAVRLQALKPGGPDVVIEAIGIPSTYLMSVDLVAYTGRVVYIGYSSEPVAYQTKKFVQKELDIRGSRNSMPEDFADAVSILKSGTFPTDAMVSRTVPFNEAGDVLEYWNGQPGKVMRIVVDMGLSV